MFLVRVALLTPTLGSGSEEVGLEGALNSAEASEQGGGRSSMFLVRVALLTPTLGSGKRGSRS
jgi:hypothetical protein